MDNFEKKAGKLRQIMKGYAKEDIAVAFSGGTDSSLLLKAACEAAAENGRRVYGMFLDTALHPAGEVQDAKKVAEETGAIFKVLNIDEFEQAGIEDNPKDRCYRCKKYLFQSILEEASRLNVGVVMEGTNEDDLLAYRPGIRAVKELGVVSPLAEAGLTKAEVRKLAGEYGVSVFDRPASPCLATRFPYGTHLLRTEIERVGRAEDFLKKMGFYNVRVRVHDNLARIEVDADSFPQLMDKREGIVKELRDLGYTYVTMDLEGFRSGSMDIRLGERETEE